MHAAKDAIALHRHLCQQRVDEPLQYLNLLLQSWIPREILTTKLAQLVGRSFPSVLLGNNSSCSIWNSCTKESSLCSKSFNTAICLFTSAGGVMGGGLSLGMLTFPPLISRNGLAVRSCALLGSALRNRRACV
eukprot:CAMPEP_0115558644 /NCGR_PEP_ID=MMETSP0271-20121206/99549_1 /TAXON_ID=71861 /ORGANISM="Scrippsiella trochoidea, Strain CCMP3099" /LENGTH=132 /DNA_ID=CAMNT_0002992675 /DNA_START=41 /DNA_END=440 /DNA_ORIENTATION=-